MSLDLNLCIIHHSSHDFLVLFAYPFLLFSCEIVCINDNILVRYIRDCRREIKIWMISCIISLHWTEKLCRIAVPTNIISIGKMKPHATNNWESLFPNSIDVYSHFALCSWTPCFDPGVTHWLNKGWLSHLRWEKLNPLSKYF